PERVGVRVGVRDRVGVIDGDGAGVSGGSAPLSTTDTVSANAADVATSGRPSWLKSLITRRSGAELIGTDSENTNPPVPFPFHSSTLPPLRLVTTISLRPS